MAVCRWADSLVGELVVQENRITAGEKPSEGKKLASVQLERWPLRGAGNHLSEEEGKWPQVQVG